MAKDFRKIAINRLRWYAGADADCTLRSYLRQRDTWGAGPFGDTWRSVYGPATWALGHVERWGAILSEANVRRYDTFLEGRIAQHRETLVSAGGEKFREFNPGSPPQMADFLFGQLQLKGKKKTETGKLSTAADVVHELIEGKWGVAFDKATGNPILAPELLAEKRAQNRDLDAVMAVLDLKDAKTQKSKFGVGYLKHIGYDGRVHTKYGIARTLRLTSKEPQLQNLVSPYDSPLIKDEDDPGKWARGVYVPPPGWVILSMDFSQVELRIGAVLSGDPAMAQAFRSGVDFHTATAMRVFSVTNPKDVNKAQRRVAKEVNFSIPYGMTKRGLALKLGITEDKAQEYLDAYDVAYPVFAAWRRRQVAMGYDVGEVLAAFNGWTVRRRVPDLGETGDNPTVRGMKMHGENVCKNCVDDATEGLTQRGWVAGPDMRPGDVLLTKNAETGRLEWQAATDVKRWPDYEGPLVEYRSKTFSAVSTPNHRWLVTDKKGRTQCRLTGHMRDGDDRIHRTGVFDGAPDGPWTDDFIEMAGWFLTDGSITHRRKVGSQKSVGGSVMLCQTKAHGVLAIDWMFQRMGAKVVRAGAGRAKQDPGTVYRRRGPAGDVVWRFSGAHAQALIVAFPERALTFDFVADLSGRQARILMAAMMAGDGSDDGNKEVFHVRSEAGAAAFQALATLCGRASTARWRDMSNYTPRSKKLRNVPRMSGCWIVTLLRRENVQVTKKQRRAFVSKQPIWCPIVPNTYFVARREGKVFITGNTPIQGLANLVCLDAMVRVVRWLLDTRAPAELNMNVHDALVMYVRRDALLPVARQVRSLMTRVDTGAVPLVVDAEVGEADYGHMQKLDLDAAA